MGVYKDKCVFFFEEVIFILSGLSHGVFDAFFGVVAVVASESVSGSDVVVDFLSEFEEVVAGECLGSDVDDVFSGCGFVRRWFLGEVDFFEVEFAVAEDFGVFVFVFAGVSDGVVVDGGSGVGGEDRQIKVPGRSVALCEFSDGVEEVFCHSDVFEGFGGLSHHGECFELDAVVEGEFGSSVVDVDGGVFFDVVFEDSVGSAFVAGEEDVEPGSFHGWCDVGVFDEEF